MPLEYLIYVMLLVAVFCGGGLLFVVGWELGRRKLKIFGGGLMAGVVVWLVVGTIQESQTDWNPRIASDEQIVGTWSGPRETLVLQADHTFTYQADTDTLSGTWSRQDWNLTLMTRSTHREMRVILHSGKLRVMTHPPENIDLWDGDPGLKLQE